MFPIPNTDCSPIREDPANPVKKASDLLSRQEEEGAERPLRFGLVSTSSIAPRFLAALKESGVGRAVALYSREEEKAVRMANAWDIPFATSRWEEFLGREDVDAVYISSVNAAHYTQAKDALAAGKHVLCEKPCTVSSSQTRRLFALARAQGRMLMEAQKMLFLPAVQEAKRWIDTGKLGKPISLTASHSFSPSYNDWMFDPALSGLGGGPLASSGIYAVELLLFLVGEIHAIHGHFTRDQEGRVRQYRLCGTCGENVSFSLQNSTLSALDNCAHIRGEKGSILLKNYWKADTLTVKTEEETVLSYPCRHELIYEIRHFARCVHQGLTQSPVATEALSVAGIEALERSILQ